ncbi:hypothetical protein [Alloyangia mangrovi]|uniref:hypothetical protein n=1 Tax=Alloyangia mangrovi TaxID=1779329 RepID=UPI001F1A4215|nr:hypothetical protein [Alloyangia mangrovi]
MSDQDSYADWVRSVRAEARRNLQALRRDRLARGRRGRRVAEDSSPDIQSPEALPLSVSRQTAGMVRTECPDSLAAAEPQADKAAEGACDAPSSRPGEAGAEDAPWVDTAAQRSAGDAALECGPPDQEVTPGPVPAPTEPSRACASNEAPEATLCWAEEELRDSTLTRLPGAGIGLVWLLHANGIGSLEGLATVDAEALKQRLGLVGQLVDVQAWIDFAKSDPGDP